MRVMINDALYDSEDMPIVWKLTIDELNTLISLVEHGGLSESPIMCSGVDPVTENLEYNAWIRRFETLDRRHNLEITDEQFDAILLHAYYELLTKKQLTPEDVKEENLPPLNEVGKEALRQLEGLDIIEVIKERMALRGDSEE